MKKEVDLSKFVKEIYGCDWQPWWYNSKNKIRNYVRWEGKMKKRQLMALISLALISLVGFGCDGGTSGITSERVSGVSDTSEAVLYYPNTISGSVGATTMSSGYTGTLSQVEWLSEEVAKAGYVVLAFTPTNTLGMVSGWRDAHKSCIARLKTINSNHSVLRGKINTSKLSTCGHSKGGGGSLWASSQLTTQLKTTVGMAPYEEGFADSALRTITAATFIQAGASDTLATNSMTRGEYSGLSTNISRMYVEYTGYSHMAWASASGSTASRLSGDIIAWMKYYLDGQTSYASALSNVSGTTRHEWVDKGSSSSSSSSGSSSGGCN